MLAQAPQPRASSSLLPLAAMASPVSVTWPAAGYGNKAFTGREWDPEAGLYYYRARYYDPKVGRFISEDPIGFRGGINLYAYAANAPVRWLDPDGLTVQNNTHEPRWVKPENGPPGVLPPDQEWSGSPDGVENKDGSWRKFQGKDWLPDNDVEIDHDTGEPICVGGPCGYLPETDLPGDPDSGWTKPPVKDPKKNPLPGGTKPIQCK